MPSIKQTITSHNKSVIGKVATPDTTQPNCNCRKDKACPLDGQCLTTGIIYQATVVRQDNNNTETYIGLTDNSFKTRYNAHTSSFRNESKRNSTTLSQVIWKLKDSNIPHTISWSIISKAKAYTPASKSCHLCLKEKYFIICQPSKSSLNTRNELASECRHHKRHLLSNFNP